MARWRSGTQVPELVQKLHSVRVPGVQDEGRSGYVRDGALRQGVSPIVVNGLGEAGRDCGEVMGRTFSMVGGEGCHDQKARKARRLVGQHRPGWLM